MSNLTPALTDRGSHRAEQARRSARLLRLKYSGELRFDDRLDKAEIAAAVVAAAVAFSPWLQQQIDRATSAYLPAPGTAPSIVIGIASAVIIVTCVLARFRKRKDYVAMDEQAATLEIYADRIENILLEPDDNHAAVRLHDALALMDESLQAVERRWLDVVDPTWKRRLKIRQP